MNADKEGHPMNWKVTRADSYANFAPYTLTIQVESKHHETVLKALFARSFSVPEFIEQRCQVADSSSSVSREDIHAFMETVFARLA